MGRPWSFDRNDYLKCSSAGWGGGPAVWRSDMQMLERGNGVVVGRRNPLLGGVLVLLILVSMARAQLDILAQKVIWILTSWFSVMRTFLKHCNLRFCVSRSLNYESCLQPVSNNCYDSPTFLDITFGSAKAFRLQSFDTFENFSCF